MAQPKPALYAAGLTALAFICLTLAAAAVAIPIWGHFEKLSGGYDSERGYFGPWKTCKKLSYNREHCGEFRFKPSVGVYISGILAAISCSCLGIYCIMSILQIAMISSRDKVVMKYKPLVIIKFILSIAAALLAIASAVLFATQLDGPDRAFSVEPGVSFYLQIVVIVTTVSLFIMSLYDVFFVMRAGGDPTDAVEISSAPATTYNNPGFREGRRTNGTATTVSMTDSSGKPYVTSGGGAGGGGGGSSVTNGGSMASMNTTLTSVSNGSTLDSSVTRSPLRSSLKKPKPRDGLGIQNPGYSGSTQSPTSMRRNGSVKKVRIQTHSTEV